MKRPVQIVLLIVFRITNFLGVNFRRVRRTISEMMMSTQTPERPAHIGTTLARG
jgi:hypothetical protein